MRSLEKVSKNQPRLAVSEHELQARIKFALEVAGFGVWHTSAFRQKGPSGVSKGVPDLLVWHVLVPRTFLGIEVKRPGRVAYSSAQQREAHEADRFHLVQSDAQAVFAAHWWLCRCRDGFKDGLVEQVTSFESALARSRRALIALCGTDAAIDDA